ncbi:MAG: hypothetical protein BWK73_04635 [Thiothrix lacustris]|uniref:Uncharacterized protein n=1 Tax=Thiothrix lacustris TaxID=525917 RepID=A0A1Y1QY37_9GAMM|nr:MAG: hypothetical protein BWK73_04635 [Thiothrix lacustris]
MTALLDMSLMPAPPLIEPLDVEAILLDMKQTFNGLQPSLLDASQRPVVLDAELVETASGERYWKVPADAAIGLHYLDYEAEPVVKLLEAAAFRELLLRQRINKAAKVLMIAYSSGADLDNMAADFGVVRLAGESDERLRYRRQLALESFTTAGSRGSYEFHALTADVRVQDVFVDRPTFQRVTWAALGLEPPRPNLMVLECTYDARLPAPIPGDVAVTTLPSLGADAAVVQAAVSAALDREEVIPLTDNPQMLTHAEVTYDVVATLWCYPGPSTAPIVDAATLELQAYVADHYRLGHDIAISGLHQAAHRPGVQRVELNLTDDITVLPYQAARCLSVTVLLGGRDV